MGASPMQSWTPRGIFCRAYVDPNEGHFSSTTRVHAFVHGQTCLARITFWQSSNGEETMKRVVHRVLAVTAAFQLIAGTAFADGDLSRDTRVRIGFKVAASQHIELDPDVPSQGLGSFLVTVSSCNDCSRSLTCAWRRPRSAAARASQPRQLLGWWTLVSNPNGDLLFQEPHARARHRSTRWIDAGPVRPCHKDRLRSAG